jgi:hypothetical protein
VSFFIGTEETFSRSFGQCIGQWAESSRKAEPNQKGLKIAVVIESRAVCSIRLIDRHNGLFAALAAFIIAWFTYTLDRSTKWLWKTEERNFREAERAFVFLEGFNAEISTAEDASETKVVAELLPKEYRSDPDLYITRFAVAPKWKNGGATPTKNMTIKVNWCGPNGDLVLDYSYKKPPTQFFVAPQAVERSDVFEIPSARAIVDWSWHPFGDPPLILIWGRADYEDIFGRNHFVEWCYRVGFSRPYRRGRISASFTQWGDYNRSD